MSYTLNQRLQWKPKANSADKLNEWLNETDADTYVVPSSQVKESYVAKVTNYVSSLQSIVNAMTRSSDPALISAALSEFSETLIIATGIAACQRLIDQPEVCTSDEGYIRKVISTALILKQEDEMLAKINQL